MDISSGELCTHEQSLSEEPHEMNVVPAKEGCRCLQVILCGQ